MNRNRQPKNKVSFHHTNNKNAILKKQRIKFDNFIINK